MNISNNIKLSTRLFMAFGLVILLFSAVGVYGLLQMNKLSALTDDMYDHPLQVTKAMLIADHQITAMHRDMNDLLLTSDAEEIATIVAQIDALETSTYQQFDIAEQGVLGAEGLALVSATRQHFADWKPVRDGVIELKVDGESEAAIALADQTIASQVALIGTSMEPLKTFVDAQALEMLGDSQTTRSTAITVSAVAISATIAASVLVAFVLIRTVTGPLSCGIKMIQAMAIGDVSSRLAMDRKDEIGTLANAMDQLADSTAAMADAADRVAAGDLGVTVDIRSEDDILGKAFSQVVETLRRSTSDLNLAVGQLSSSATQILAASSEVASGTAQTSTSINETTATVEQVRQAAQLSSQKAQDVSENSRRVAEVSISGQRAVEETSIGMDGIREQMSTIAGTVVRLSEQSQSIGGIIASVNDLADQSNLLAVNATIEAAKAGEQGRGFAVVAQEIKSLAEQSKEATAQIRDILSDVQKATSAAVMATEQGSKAIDAGVTQAAVAGEAITMLSETSDAAVQAAAQIVASSQEQVVGMDQIGIAMENINQAGAQAATSMHQMEVSAQDLHELGKTLQRLVAQFKT